MGNYDDIIHLSHHVSETHPHMPVIDRAAQFSPFAALTGYEDAVKETARLTDKRMELDEYEKYALNERLRVVADWIDEQPEISITYFQQDDRKEGGTYRTVTGCVKIIDDHEHIVCLTDGTKIGIDDIIEIESTLIHEYL